MRFGLVHRIMTDLLAALGVLAVVSTAQMPLAANVVLLVGLALALAIPEEWQSKPVLQQIAVVGPVALFVVEGARLALGRSALDVAVEFAAMLQILRLATRKGAAHDQQIIVLALLHFVAGTVLGGGFSYGLCFLGFLIVAPGALVLSHLRREVEGNYRQGARDRTGLPVDVPRILRSRRVVGQQFLLSTCLLSIPIFVFTATLFILFPRVGLSFLLLPHPQQHLIGFTDRVDLGQVGVLRDDRSLVMRVTPNEIADPPPAKLTFRLRGTALYDYDGRAWSRAPLEHKAPMDHRGDEYTLYPRTERRPSKTVTIDLEGIDPPVIFLPLNTYALRVTAPAQALLGDPLVIYRGAEDELRYGGADARGLHYQAVVAGDQELLPQSLPAAERPRYLRTPEVSPRVRALAHEWTDGATSSYQKAKALEEHLRKEYSYDLNSSSKGKKDPLDDFLFVSHRGHCEFFSSAMAIMLREIGVPSRNVVGFVGGTYNAFGKYYAVHQGDAHSWVEGYIDDIAHPTWVTFDPTPPAGAQPLESTTGFFVYVHDMFEAISQRWNRYVLGYDFNQQLHLFESIGKRYETFRRSSNLDKGAAGWLTRPPILAAGFALLSMAAYGLWRRRRSGASSDPKQRTDAPDRNVLAATALYRALEAALSANGISRPVSTPPLRHAEDLQARKHPLGSEVVALTTVYLEARFGGARLDDGARRDFERRVRGIRQWRPAEGQAPSAEA
jgi:transglutaminase-like putative cysteine protease